MNARFAFSVAALALVATTPMTFAAPPDQPGHISPQPGTENDTASAVKDAAGHAVGTVEAVVITKLPDFVNAAAISDMFEVEAGKIALQRSHNAQVTGFARKMVDAHTETTKELKATLTRINSTVTPPSALDDRHQGMIDELRGATDGDFDIRYMSQQVDAHREALILVRGYSKDGDTPAVKAFAAKIEPAVQSHLDMAKKIYEKKSS
jgi:putative membrane protein